MTQSNRHRLAPQGYCRAGHAARGNVTKPPDDAFDEARDFKTGIPLLDDRIHKYFSQTQKQAGAQISHAIDNDAPIAMFFLLPLFAGLLQLAYLRHHLRYGVHLLFSLHYHAFVFLDLLLQEIPWPSIVGHGTELRHPRLPGAGAAPGLRRQTGGRPDLAVMRRCCWSTWP